MFYKNMFHAIGRIIKFAAQDFWRNIWLSVITITILVMALFSVNFLIVFNLIADNVISAVHEKIDVSIYFVPEATAGEVSNVKSSLDKLVEVKEIKYISPEEALQKFQEEHAEDPDILESLEQIEGNPLGAALVVKAKRLDDYPKILDEVNKPEYQNIIQDKNFEDHKAIIGKINNITEKVETVGLIVIAVFILIAIVIVFNTIKIAIYTHRGEIEIKRLVGATNWFISAPFIVEGIFYSLIACLLIIAIIYPLIGILDPYLIKFFEGLDFSVLNYFNEHFFAIFGLQLVLVIILNVISSSLAIGKYLRV